MLKKITVNLSDKIITHTGMNRIASYLMIMAGFSLLFSACLPPKTIGTTGEDTYSEDLSKLRAAHVDTLSGTNDPATTNNTAPQPETPTLNASISTRFSVNNELDDFLDEVTQRNQENNTYQGYTVQVYTGSSREKANDAKNKVYSILPEENPTITFDTPNYKVKIGEYTDRLEAQPVYSALKDAFPAVLIVPQRFPIVTKE